ncbi:MAG: precorrin-8X methylmutase [Candidatus Obscuribacter sp.]|nr:precorrin-8X methylmutase [Candidatus Obscuribacter sp.]
MQQTAPHSSAQAQENDVYSVVLAGHGSRDRQGVQEFEEMVELLKATLATEGKPVYHGYLEFAEPTISQAVRKAIEEGARKVVVVPALLFAATHAKNDMPGELTALRQEFPDTEINYASAMDLHPLLLKLARERIIEAESSAPSSSLIRRSETCLVVVGRGTSDPDANSEISKLCRMLEEGMGFGTSFVCYSGTARPNTEDGIKAALKLGKKRIIVLPFLLFNGVLVKRIQETAAQLAGQLRHKANQEQTEILTAGYMGVHPYLAKVFAERAQEGIMGKATMDCSLCKYRVQIVGFERQVAEVQKSNHIKPPTPAPLLAPYQPHPIEAESMSIIARNTDFSNLSAVERAVAMRIVHTAGDFNAADDLYFSGGAAEAGVRALLRLRRIAVDVTMVESGLKRSILKDLGITTWCGVHEEEAFLLAEKTGLTRSAAGMRMAFEKFGNDIIVAIGDAPTAIFELVRLVEEQHWRPQLVIGLPVGFVGTVDSKERLRRCLQIPRITNAGTRGGSPWAATVLNALLIEALKRASSNSQVSP